DIGAMIDVASAYLFRRHVAGRAHDRAWVGVHFSCGNIGLRDLFCGRLDQLCQAKVENFYVVVFGDEEVVRLEIAMNDAFRMRGRKTACYLNSILGGFARGQWSMIETFPKRLAFQ